MAVWTTIGMPFCYTLDLVRIFLIHIFNKDASNEVKYLNSKGKTPTNYYNRKAQHYLLL